MSPTTDSHSAVSPPLESRPGAARPDRRTARDRRLPRADQPDARHRRVQGRGGRGQARHRGQRHPDPAPQPRLGRPPRRPVRPGLGRDRRRPPHALLLARLPGGLRPRAGDHGQAPPRGAGLELPRRPRPARHGDRPLAGRRRLPPSRSAPRLDPPDRRRQRHHPPDGDPPHPLRRGTRGTDRADPVRARPRAHDLPRGARPPGGREPELQPDPLLHARARRRRARRPLQPGPPSPGRPQLRRRAETFACGPPALLDAVRGTWANGLEQRLHVESFVPPSLLPVGRARDGLDPLRRLGRRGPATAAPRSSSRPRRPASRRSRAAAWGSATPAPAAR